jgi:predicted amidohydrolase
VAVVRKMVAVQPRVEIGAVEKNLAHLEDLIRQAATEHEPDAIWLPEAMTSPNAYDRRMRHVARPLLGEPLAVLRRLAREYGCLVGGGFIAIRGKDARGTYALCEPDGSIHLHDKDQPSFWENNYYAAGSDDGVMTTSLGRIGCANGFEWGRTRTVRRLVGRVQLLAGGMHFPSFPTWRLTRRWFWDRDHQALLQYARETPPRMARLLGVPAVHPSHVGDMTMATMLLPGVRWPTICVGETAICDADGRVLERMSYADGEGYICQEVTLEDEPRPRDPCPPYFWNSLLPVSVHAVWVVGNLHGAAKYRAMKRLGMHAWQKDGPHGDLPAYVPADQAPPLPEPDTAAARV